VCYVPHNETLSGLIVVDKAQNDLQPPPILPPQQSQNKLDSDLERAAALANVRFSFIVIFIHHQALSDEDSQWINACIACLEGKADALTRYITDGRSLTRKITGECSFGLSVCDVYSQ
jgi:hypothetical protein